MIRGIGNRARSHAITALAAAIALTLAGCGLLGGPTKDARYGSVVEFRDALVDAGYDCPDWDQSDQVPRAAQSGSCSSADVLMTFTSTEDRDSLVKDFKSTMEAFDMDVNLLVGPNWVLNSKKATQMQEAMGGSLVTK